MAAHHDVPLALDDGARGMSVAAAARGLVGVRFRPQGRDPAHGLDCVGLVLAALAGGGVRASAPRDYPGRGGPVEAAAALIAAAGLVRADGLVPGDVLLMTCGAGQLHLGIRTQAGMVHAEAGLRRVVERPGAPPWPIVGAWRS